MPRSGRMLRGPAATLCAAMGPGWIALSLCLHDPVGAAGEPEPTVPTRLSETGLYLPDGSIDPRNRQFAPQYPLWTDDAAKARWIRLPEGATIDVSDIDAWRFPPGTVLWKEFSWSGRRIETRMIRHETGGTWTFASYVWAEDQSDATLAPEGGIPNVFEFSPGQRHSIPGVADCGTCHLSSPAVVLGFTALQLSDDRDPLAPHAEPLPPDSITLRSLEEEGWLRPPRPDLVLRPPRIRETDPRSRAALGYLSANCGGCHNSRGPLARLGLDLLHDVAGDPRAPEPAEATAAGTPGRYVLPGASPDSSWIVAPGAPQHSTLLHRMQSRRPSSQMPPLGSVKVDEQAVALVRAWIDSLPRPPSL